MEIEERRKSEILANRLDREIMRVMKKIIDYGLKKLEEKGEEVPELNYKFEVGGERLRRTLTFEISVSEEDLKRLVEESEE